jgi:hypothetical protein
MNADIQEIVKALRCCGIHTDDKNCGECPICSSDTPCPDLMPHAADLLESLSAQLTESQRRERAAVKDIGRNWMCASCERRVAGHEWCNCEDRHFVKTDSDAVTCSKFVWRGPGEGKEDGK